MVASKIRKWTLRPQKLMRANPNATSEDASTMPITLTMVLYLYNKGFQQFHFGYASAIAWVLFMIVLVFTMMVLRSSEAWVYYEGEMHK